MKAICEKANECKETECYHRESHDVINALYCGICKLDTGVKGSMCTPLKEEPMEQKLEGLEVKHTILVDQEKKTDAGKLRYDLIEWDVLDRITISGIDSSELTRIGNGTNVTEAEYLRTWIVTAIIALGGMNNFLYELARVYTFGAKEYGDESWKTVPNAEARYLGAMQRHIREFEKGNYVNYQDGMLYHSAQIAWNAISLLWFKQNKGE